MEDWNQCPSDFSVGEFYGGDLEGVRQKLNYLQNLGVEVIYFNPLLCHHPITNMIFRTMTISIPIMEKLWSMRGNFYNPGQRITAGQRVM